MQLEARAKINWTLDITGRRADGYHLLDMLMQPITLSDTITLEKADRVTLTVSGSPCIPPDDNHLALRAARALKEASGYPGGAAIHVHKRIPSGAGLGGGSADAAGVLAGLNRLWELGLCQETLEQLGLTLGADVPFCLRGGLAHVGGIGEKMENLPGCPEWPLLVIQPCEGLSTASVFRAYHAAQNVQRPDNAAALRALCSGSIDALIPALGNALEAVSCVKQPAISEAILRLQSHGALCARMSGSGSAVFGVFRSDDDAQAAANALRVLYERLHLCRTARDSIVFA